MWATPVESAGGVRKVTPYLYRMAANLCTDRLRRRRPVMIPMEDLEPDALSDQRAIASQVLAASESLRRTDLLLSRLPDKQAEALSELAAIRRQIGAQDYAMLHAVCCEQIPFMRWVEGQFPDAGRQTRLDAYARLRDALDGLVGYFGVAVGKFSTVRAYRAPLVPEQDLTPAS